MMPQMATGAGLERPVDLTASFDALYEREARVVLRYLSTAVRHQSAAEDLCGDTFCKAWDAWPRFRGGDAEARAWLLRIARNLVIDRVRRDGRLKFVALEDAAAAGHDEISADAIDLRNALSALPRAERDLIALRVAGLSHEEIAQVQGRSVDAVRKGWQRALTRVRALMETPS